MHIAKTQVGNRMVSTICTGREYETMVFECNAAGKVTNYAEVLGRRYMNEETAWEGHWEIVRNMGG